MNNLDTLYQEAKLIIEQNGIPIGRIKSVERNSKLTRTWGRCRKNGDGTFSIDISGILLDEGSSNGVLETLLHEMIHTCKGCFNHKNTWKKYAEILNSKYDFHIQRTDTAADKGVENPTKRIYRYQVKCPKCNNVYQYQKMTNVVKYPSLYICRRCGCSLERVL